MISFGEALRDEDTEAGQGDLEEFFALRADLMAEADARDFNQNEDEALDLEARQQSWASVGISPQDAWISVAAATEVMASYLEEAGEQQAGSAQRLRAHSQVELSLRVQAHVEAQMEREEAFDQEDRDAVVEAGAQLRARLEAGTQEETQQAWEAFNASVRARLEGRLELAGQAAFLQVVEAVGAARTTLETSLEVLTSAGGYQAQAETAVGAYLLFQTSVEEMGSLLTATGTSQSQAEATVQVLAALR
jgi:hypothetical protein